MPKRFGSILTALIGSALILSMLAGCGGDEEPPATPTPLATVTPTTAPTEVPTEVHTEAPTATEAATATLEAAATLAATGTPEAAATLAATLAATTTISAAETVTATETVTVTTEGTTEGTPGAEAAGGDSFTSPLAAPESPLAAPPQATEAGTEPSTGPGTEIAATPAPPAPAPAAALRPVVGSWQLQTIKPSTTMTATTAPAGYRVAFGPTGVVRVMGDCKTGRGIYTTAAEGALTIDITYSDVRCAPDSLADPFARALNDVTTYRYEGDQLILAYGDQGGEMGLARTAQMAAFGAPFLSWPNLQNSTYLVPDVPAGDNQAPLVDGEFRARPRTIPGAEPVATPMPGEGEFVVSLSTMHTYGALVTPSPEEIAADPEITAEVSADSILVLVVEDSQPDSAPKSYLAPVLNGGGLALPLTLELLGENVLVRDLRWDGALLTVDYSQDNTARRRVYHFDSDHFVLDSETDLPPAAPKARLDLPAQPVTLGPAEGGAAGLNRASLTGNIAAGEIHPFRLPLEAGQQLSVTIQSPYDDVWLSIFGRDDLTVLRSIRSDTTTWAGSVPSTQEYLISAVAPGSGSPYTLTIEVANGSSPAAPAAPAATPVPTPGGKVVHLVIDGATLSTAAVLNLLDSNNAAADFFARVDEAAPAGSTLAAEVGGKHGIGLIAGPIRALTSDERDALFAEVSAARTALGGQAVRCLRLPAAASDAYTRAGAAELGFDVVQWDIDATGTAPQTLVGQLFPGAVIRLEESEGNVSTLEALLPALIGAGYSVQAMCR